jgi:hypothetical protein
MGLPSMHVMMSLMADKLNTLRSDKFDDGTLMT